MNTHTKIILTAVLSSFCLLVILFTIFVIPKYFAPSYAHWNALKQGIQYWIRTPLAPPTKPEPADEEDLLPERDEEQVEGPTISHTVTRTRRISPPPDPVIETLKKRIRSESYETYVDLYQGDYQASNQFELADFDIAFDNLEDQHVLGLPEQPVKTKQSEPCFSCCEKRQSHPPDEPFSSLQNGVTPQILQEGLKDMLHSNKQTPRFIED